VDQVSVLGGSHKSLLKTITILSKLSESNTQQFVPIRYPLETFLKLVRFYCFLLYDIVKKFLSSIGCVDCPKFILGAYYSQSSLYVKKVESSDDWTSELFKLYILHNRNSRLNMTKYTSPLLPALYETRYCEL